MGRGTLESQDLGGSGDDWTRVANSTEDRRAFRVKVAGAYEGVGASPVSVDVTI